MRPWLFTTLTLGAVVSSQLILPFMNRGSARGAAGPPIPQGIKLDSTRDHQQHPLMDPLGPGPVLPPEDSSPDRDEPPASSGPGSSVILSDVMGRDKSINIFAGFTRDIESVSNRLDDPAQNSTVLAPLNSAIEKLPRKPWEDPRDYGALGSNAYEGDDGHERAQRNLRRFVEAHLVPASPWKEGEKVKPVGEDREIWWEERDGKRVVSLAR